MAANSPFVLRSFIQGIGKTLDLSGSIKKKKSTYIRSDTEALKSDWISVGRDLDSAMVDYGKQHEFKDK